MSINKCTQCGSLSPGSSTACPKCAGPVKAVSHEHVWKTAITNNNMPKYVCRECGRVQTIRKFKYQVPQKV